MRRALALAAVAAAALGGSVATIQLTSSTQATAAPRTLEQRVASLEARVSGMCTSFRQFESARAFHDYDPQFATLVREIQAACGAARTTRRDHHPKRRTREDHKRPPPAPPHEG